MCCAKLFRLVLVEHAGAGRDGDAGFSERLFHAQLRFKQADLALADAGNVEFAAQAGIGFHPVFVMGFEAVDRTIFANEMPAGVAKLVEQVQVVYPVVLGEHVL